MLRLPRCKAAFILVLAGLSTSCAMDERLKELAAPQVACAQTDRELVEARGNASAATYMVRCDGGPTYRCISRGRPFGEEPDTVCVADSAGRLDGEEVVQ